MYATQKYTATDRVAVAQEWSAKYPDRVAVVLSSPHWAFYCFKCMLVPKYMAVRELAETILKSWTSKFPSGTTHVLLKTPAVADPLSPEWTIYETASKRLGPDGFLYLTAHRMD